MTSDAVERGVIREHFDRVAPDYETNRLGPWYIGHGNFIADHLEGGSYQRAMDVGCGTGWLLRELVRRGIAVSGLGIDLSPRMVEVATHFADPTPGLALEFVCDAWPDIADETTAMIDMVPPDLAIFASSLHYAPDLDLALRRVREALAPGGRVVILERAPERSFLTRLWGRAHETVILDGARFTSTGELLERLRDAGFDDVRNMGYLERWFWRGKLSTSMALSTARTPSARAGAPEEEEVEFDR